mmetsp:Transcript_40880/g.103579  ORF Transcript_40880/g.103579 Transcript_40880/m.103579 type:complete len:445 (+) Transcript_40880:449-1783(+)
MTSLLERTCWSQLMQCVPRALGPEATIRAEGDSSRKRMSISLRMPFICMRKSLRSIASAFSSSAAATRSLMAFSPRRMAPSSWPIFCADFLSDASSMARLTFSPLLSSMRVSSFCDSCSMALRSVISITSISDCSATWLRSALSLLSISMRSSMDAMALITRFTFRSALSTARATDLSSIASLTASAASSFLISTAASFSCSMLSPSFTGATAAGTDTCTWSSRALMPSSSPRSTSIVCGPTTVAWRLTSTSSCFTLSMSDFRLPRSSWDAVPICSIAVLVVVTASLRLPSLSSSFAAVAVDPSSVAAIRRRSSWTSRTSASLADVAEDSCACSALFAPSMFSLLASTASMSRLRRAVSACVSASGPFTAAMRPSITSMRSSMEIICFVMRVLSALASCPAMVAILALSSASSSASRSNIPSALLSTLGCSRMALRSSAIRCFH